MAAFLGGDANAFYNEYEHLFCYAAQGNISYNIKNMAPRTGYSSYSREGWRGYFVPTFEAVECFLSKNGLPMEVDPETKEAIQNPTKLVDARATQERRPPSSTSTGSQDSTHQSVTTVDHTTSTARPLCSSAAVGKSSRTMETPVMNIKAAQSYYVKKWIHKSNNFDNTSKTFTYHKFAFPYIRFAEPYLDFVEAYVQYYGKIDGEALTYINKVRNRAGLPDFEDSWALVGGLPTGKTLLDAVLRERLSEFAFEGRWFYDLRRYKVVQNILQNKATFLEHRRQDSRGLLQDHRGL